MILTELTQEDFIGSAIYAVQRAKEDHSILPQSRSNPAQAKELAEAIRDFNLALFKNTPDSNPTHCISYSITPTETYALDRHILFKNNVTGTGIEVILDPYMQVQHFSLKKLTA